MFTFWSEDQVSPASIMEMQTQSFASTIQMGILIIYSGRSIIRYTTISLFWDWHKRQLLKTIISMISQDGCLYFVKLIIIVGITYSEDVNFLYSFVISITTSNIKTSAIPKDSFRTAVLNILENPLLLTPDVHYKVIHT